MAAHGRITECNKSKNVIDTATARSAITTHLPNDDQNEMLRPLQAHARLTHRRSRLQHVHDIMPERVASL